MTLELIAEAFIAVLFAIGAALFVGAILMPSITKFDTFKKTKRFELTVGQLQKLYDWKISQYTSIGNAFLSALVPFVGSVVFETLKNPSFSVDMAFYFGVGITLCLVMLFHLEVRALRNGFYEGYVSVDQLADLAAKISGTAMS